MKTHLTLSQRIHNAEGMQAAEYLHARHTYLHATSYCKEEWGEFWDTSEEASWGHLFGVMCGFDEVWYNSVSNYDPDGFRGYINLVKQHPEISWFDARSIREISMHTLATDIIEAADDGKTVRASFLTPGVLVFALNANHHYRGLTLWERYGSDFVYDEDSGEWLYLHEQVCPDMGGPMDVCNPGMVPITSSWASAAAPVVPDPAWPPVRAVQVVQVVPAADLVAPAADLAQVVLPRDRVAHPVQAARLLRGWVAHPVQAALLRAVLVRARMPRCPVWL